MSNKGDKNILKGAFEEKLDAKSDSFHVTTPPRKSSPSTQSSPTSDLKVEHQRSESTTDISENFALTKRSVLRNGTPEGWKRTFYVKSPLKLLLEFYKDNQTGLFTLTFEKSLFREITKEKSFVDFKCKKNLELSSCVKLEFCEVSLLINIIVDIARARAIADADFTSLLTDFSENVLTELNNIEDLAKTHAEKSKIVSSLQVTDQEIKFTIDTYIDNIICRTVKDTTKDNKDRAKIIYYIDDKSDRNHIFEVHVINAHHDAYHFSEFQMHFRNLSPELRSQIQHIISNNIGYSNCVFLNESAKTGFIFSVQKIRHAQISRIIESFTNSLEKSRAEEDINFLCLFKRQDEHRNYIVLNEITFYQGRILDKAEEKPIFLYESIDRTAVFFKKGQRSVEKDKRPFFSIAFSPCISIIFHFNDCYLKKALEDWLKLAQDQLEFIPLDGGENIKIALITDPLTLQVTEKSLSIAHSTYGQLISLINTLRKIDTESQFSQEYNELLILLNQSDEHDVNSVLKAIQRQFNVMSLVPEWKVIKNHTDRINDKWIQQNPLLVQTHITWLSFKKGSNLVEIGVDNLNSINPLFYLGLGFDSNKKVEQFIHFLNIFSKKNPMLLSQDTLKNNILHISREISGKKERQFLIQGVSLNVAQEIMNACIAYNDSCFPKNTKKLYFWETAKSPLPIDFTEISAKLQEELPKMLSAEMKALPVATALSRIR